MKKQSLFLILAVIFFQYTLAIAGEHPVDKKLEESIKKDWTTDGMNNATGEACKEWDAEMNKYYKLLMGILNKEEKQALKESQRAWLVHRDLETKFRMGVFFEYTRFNV